jgi:hypothetical protein
MATEHTCTELVHEKDLASLAGEYVDHGARRHVAFVVLEELLRRAPEDEVTFTVTVSRRSRGTLSMGPCVGFTAVGQVAEQDV